jgi:hypothetical protein
LTSLRTRLLLAYAGLILVGFTVLALLAGRQISAGTVQDFTDGLAEQAELVAQGIKETVEEIGEDEESSAALPSLLETYAGQVSADIVLVDRNGRFWAGSSSTTHTDTPEIAAALNGTAITGTRDGMAFAAAPIVEDGRVLAVVQPQNHGAGGPLPRTGVQLGRRSCQSGSGSDRPLRPGDLRRWSVGILKLQP